MTARLTRKGVLQGACAGCLALVAAACGGSSKPAARGTGSRVLAKLADVPVGGSVAARAPDGRPLLLARRTATSPVVAFVAICTHQGCTVEPDGAVLGCPCHDAAYDAFTGRVLSPPAPAPLPPYPVKVVGDAVVPA